MWQVFKDKCKSFKSFKLVDVYKIIFPNNAFKARDALADTRALRKVCSESTYSDRIFKEIVSNSRQLSSIRKRALFEVREKQNEQELFQLLKLDTPSKRMAKLGISVQILKEMGSQSFAWFLCTFAWDSHKLISSNVLNDFLLT